MNLGDFLRWIKGSTSPVIYDTDKLNLGDQSRWAKGAPSPVQINKTKINKSITSDAAVKVVGIQTTKTSDAKIIIKQTELIDSNAVVKSINPKTILSDTKIKVFDNQENITSDAEIIPTVIKTILSDAKIKVFDNQETILSDAKIILRLQENITSDATIKITGIQTTKTSDAKIAIQVLYDISNKFNLVGQTLKDINNTFNSVIRVLNNIGNKFNTVNGRILNAINDFRTKKRVSKNCKNDIRFLQSWQLPGTIGFQSLGKSYIHVYIDSIEQTDVDIDSINIYKTINTAHTASFNLGRAYDSTKPSIETLVEIKYHIWTLYKGYIVSIAPSDDPESITINCEDKYWQQNKTNKYFHVGHKPTDDKELYYETIKLALSSELDWNLNIGDFVPQTIDCFSTGSSDCITSLIAECGNYGWYYDVNGNKQLWNAGEGSIVSLNRQILGTNIKLYDVINHRFSEDITDLINKFRVQMGNKVIRKFSDKGSSRTYTGYNYSSFQGYLTPAWNPNYEIMAKNSGDGYGWDYPEPEYEQEYAKVFKKYYIPYLDTELSSWSDRYPPRIEIHNPGGYYGSSIGTITEGFSIDYENRLLTFNTPQFLYKTNNYGEVTSIRAPLLKLFLWKKNYYTFTQTPSDDPETDISNPLMFFVEMGDYPYTIIEDLDLSQLSIQEGYTYVDEEGITQVIPSWDDTNFAEDYANWQLSKQCDKKITGEIDLVLDTICFYDIDLSKRIYIYGITDSAMNINSISYKLSNFTVTIELQNHRHYQRSISLQTHGE